jgi:nickel-dependent lactate racemase
MAGWSGGRKAVCPGLADAETIRVAHGPEILEARVGPGLLEGNPLHEALVEIVRRVGVHFAVNVVLDRKRRLAGVFAGCVEASHAEAVAFGESESRVVLDAPADLVVVSGGGAPLDATLYQSIKGVCTAQGIVRPGGAILLCAALSEGIGSASFEKCLRDSAGPDAFEARLRDPGFFAIDQWMVQHLCQARRRARVLLYSDGLPPAALGERFVEPVASPEEGVGRALDALGPGSRVAVVPQGPYVLATVRGETAPLGAGAPFPAA